MELLLSSRGNPDFGERRDPPLRSCPADATTFAADYAEASTQCVAYIAAYRLGGGNWSGGDIAVDGVVVAHVAYNGKVFRGSRWDHTVRDAPLYVPPALAAAEAAAEPAQREAAIAARVAPTTYLRRGARVKTLYQNAEAGSVVSYVDPETMNGLTDWYVVRLDSDGAKLAIHRSMLELDQGSQTRALPRKGFHNEPGAVARRGHHL